MAIFLIVQGLFAKSDSIGFDCAEQYRILKEQLPNEEVRLFAQRFDPEKHPKLPAESFSTFRDEILSRRDLTIIYHYCDGWRELDSLLPSFRGRLIIRWHNNTPPWLFVEYLRGAVGRTTRGYRAVVTLAENSACEFWSNSEFSSRQLQVLGVHPERIKTVFPLTSYLRSEAEPLRAIARSGSADLRRIRVLFVGRIVPSKGHVSLIETCGLVRQWYGADVQLDLPGRPEESAVAYIDLLKDLAAKRGVTLRLSGEVDDSTLRRLYAEADVFLCLSEHEGFGLPVYEAMQVGLPVVCWAATALEDLLHDHPLASDTTDLRWYAGAIGSAVQRGAEIAQWQARHILPAYTRERVLEQIAAGLERRTAPLLIVSAREDSLCAELRQEVMTAVENAPGEGPRPQIPEIPRNYFTLHDLQAFEYLFDDTLELGQAAAAIAGSETGASHAGLRTYLSYKRFASVGALTREGLLCNLADNGNIVHGPYVPLPAGPYSATVLLRVKNAAGGRLYVDVVTDKRIKPGDELVRVELPVSASSDWTELTVPLRFENPDVEAVAEFRIVANGFTSGSLLFRGVSFDSIPVSQAALRGASTDLPNLWAPEVESYGTTRPRPPATGRAVASEATCELRSDNGLFLGDNGRQSRTGFSCEAPVSLMTQTLGEGEAACIRLPSGSARGRATVEVRVVYGRPIIGVRVDGQRGLSDEQELSPTPAPRHVALNFPDAHSEIVIAPPRDGAVALLHLTEVWLEQAA